MDDIITKEEMQSAAEEALLAGLDYIAQNRQHSVWTGEKNGWQEKWERAQYSGLYATTNALRTLAMKPERYMDIIQNSVIEMEYMFDDNIDYKEREEDTQQIRKSKERCRFLLKQNQNTTLKAVYYLRTYRILCRDQLLRQNEEKIRQGAEKAKKQILEAYDSSTGYFVPSKGNAKDKSVLTTMQAYEVMLDEKECFDDELNSTKELFIKFLKEYAEVKNNGFKNTNKFERYKIKKNVIAAIYAISHTVDDLSKEQRCILQEVVFDTMGDAEIRNGFVITESYSVFESTISYDDYSTDSKIIYLESILLLVKKNILPFTVLEYFWDDYIEIIDTVQSEKKYVSWNMALSFSHNIKGLLVLYTLVEVLKQNNMQNLIIKINPSTVGNSARFIETKNIVLFMGFGEKYSRSFYESVNDVLEYLGFHVWCVSNEPYDQIVLDNIWNRLIKAQAVIIDCTGRSANVMYEAGLAHGFGKLVLLCGESEKSFPYETGEYYQFCIYNRDGMINPPPYQDLQLGIMNFVKQNIDDFCMSSNMKDDILEKIEKRCG